MDEVKRLLVDFADQAVDGLPAADVDADVARGRRALRRIKARRRTVGVLCVAAASTLVLAVGNQAKWWGGAGTESAEGPAAPGSGRSEAPVTTPATPSPSPRTEQTVSLFSGAGIALVANRQPWAGVSCTLAPQGWTTQPEPPAGQVVLAPPKARSSAGTETKLVLRAAVRSEQLRAVRAVRAGGRVYQLGAVRDGRRVGQVKLDRRWLVVDLPIGRAGWDDEVLRRFMASCRFN